MGVLVFAGTVISAVVLGAFCEEHLKYFICNWVACGHVHTTCITAVAALTLLVEPVQGY